MFELLSTSAWLLEAHYFSAVSQYLLDRMAAGQPLRVDEVVRSRRKSARYGEDGLPTMFYVVPGPAAVIGGAMGPSDQMAAGSAAVPKTGQKVAVIPLQGAMSKTGGYCNLGTRDVIEMIRAANADPNISSIVLDTDSPGGAVDGTEALAREVRNSKKPIVAYVDGLGASAAYWVASQASHIVVNSETSGYVGSIGVISMLINQSEALAKNGIQVNVLRSSKSPDKARPNAIEPLTDEQKAEYIARMDIIHDVFIDAVKAGRGERLDVKANPFTGKVYHGRDAVRIGLADKIGTLEDAVNLAHSAAQGDQASSSPLTTAAATVPAPQTPQANSTLSHTMFSRLSALLGATSGNANQEVTPERLAAAEKALADRETEFAALQAQLAEANETLAQRATRITELEASQTTLQEQVTTLEAWRAEQKIVDGRQQDASNTFEAEDEEKPSAMELAAREALAEQKAINATRTTFKK